MLSLKAHIAFISVNQEPLAISISIIGLAQLPRINLPPSFLQLISEKGYP